MSRKHDGERCDERRTVYSYADKYFPIGFQMANTRLGFLKQIHVSWLYVHI